MQFELPEQFYYALEQYSFASSAVTPPTPFRLLILCFQDVVKTPESINEGLKNFNSFGAKS